MRIFSFINKLCNKVASVFNIKCDYRNQDMIHLTLDGLDIEVKRYFSYDKPHEVSVFVPRAELRKKIQDGDKIKEIEIILNSITVVHSPQRPSKEGNNIAPSPPGLPEDGIIVK